MSERKKFKLPPACQISFTDPHDTGYFFDTKTGEYVLCIKGITQPQRMRR